MALATSDDHPRVVRFGRFTFDSSGNRLFDSGREVPIQELPATLLSILLNRPGGLVTREELQARLWPDKQFLEFDASLNTTVKKLRQVLRDDAVTPEYIQTVHKKGYRFIGELADEPKVIEISPDARKTKVVPISQEPESSSLEMELPPPAVNKAATFETETKEAGKASSFGFRHWRAATLAGLALILIGAAVVMLTRRGPAPDPVETQLTSNSNGDGLMDSVLSPDGKYLAYANPRHVMILNLAERATHPLSNLDRLSVFHTSWTHDSTRLLVVGYEHPGALPSLWQISILGDAQPQKVQDNVYDARQSPDGKYIAYLSADLAEISFGLSDGGERTHLYTGKRLFSPQWSPDDSRIWFIEDLEQDWRTLRSVAVNGRQESSPERKIKFLMSLLVLPDSRLLYAAPDGVFEVHGDASTGRIYGEPVRRLPPGHRIHLSSTFDGKKLAYQKGSSESDVFVGDLSEGNLRLTNTHRLTLDDAADYPHAWTKDSRSVIFESDRSGAWAFYAQPYDGPDPKMLVSSKANTVKPVVSSDGNWILYISIPHGSDMSGHLEGVKIMRIPAAGGAPAEVFAFQHETSFHCPQLSGRYCVMQEKIGSIHQYSYLDPIKGKLGPFRPPERLPDLLDWDLSPDGTSVAALPRSGDDNHVWVFKEAQPKIDIPVRNGKELRSLNWWPDGKGFFMSSNGDGKPEFLSVSIAGTAVVLTREIVSIPSWGVPSPDGKHLAFVAQPSSYNSWLAEGL